MTKGDIINIYRNMSAEDQRTFHRWAKANAVVGAILVVGLIVNISGLDSLWPRGALAEGSQATEVVAPRTSDRVMSAYELMIDAGNLPTIQVDEPF